ncbi:hypothetical protein BASA_1621 [Bifidobacterium animalis subsp. animalis]|nr:hypothetical protein BASA_1621 [Bifidobacterium animalis subsp. animalis]
MAAGVPTTTVFRNRLGYLDEAWSEGSDFVFQPSTALTPQYPVTTMRQMLKRMFDQLNRSPAALASTHVWTSQIAQAIAVRA